MSQELEPGTRVCFAFEPERKGTIKKTQLFPIPRLREYFTYYIKWDDGRLTSCRDNEIFKCQ
jgi:hypothetical protein